VIHCSHSIECHSAECRGAVSAASNSFVNLINHFIFEKLLNFDALHSANTASVRNFFASESFRRNESGRAANPFAAILNFGFARKSVFAAAVVVVGGAADRVLGQILQTFYGRNLRLQRDKLTR